MIQSLAWIHWDPERIAFTIPFVDRPVVWYGILFAFGFILGFLIILPIFKKKLVRNHQILERDIASWALLITHLKKGLNSKQISPLQQIFGKLSFDAQGSVANFKIKQEPTEVLKQEIFKALNFAMKDAKLQLSREEIEKLFPGALFTTKELSIYLADRLTWFVIGGTLIGSRLGHVFFYEWPKYQANPIDIFKVWEGGLASHGGTVGIMIALALYLKLIVRKFPEFTFVGLLDILAIPTAMAAIWIRIGNFFNQEILGPVTTVPWAVVFGHPYDGSAVLPRHPAQLYEAAAYLVTFCFLFLLWKRKGNSLKEGTIIGLFMILVFGSRFLIEFLKSPQSLMIDETFLTTGQILSIPFVILGLSFLLYSRKMRAEKITLLS